MNEFIGSMDITAKDCNLYYGDFHALKNINIEIPEKQVTNFLYFENNFFITKII